MMSQQETDAEKRLTDARNYITDLSVQVKQINNVKEDLKTLDIAIRERLNLRIYIQEQQKHVQIYTPAEILEAFKAERLKTLEIEEDKLNELLNRKV